MANITQFYRGEKIQMTVTPASGESISGVAMFVYPDNTDLTASVSTSKIVHVTNPTQSGTGYVFTISAATTKAMTAGSYTVELYYGDVSIVKQNNAFLLVDSAYALTNAGTSSGVTTVNGSNTQSES